LQGFAAAAGEVNWRPIARCWIRTSRSLRRRSRCRPGGRGGFAAAAV